MKPAHQRPPIITLFLRPSGTGPKGLRKSITWLRKIDRIIRDAAISPEKLQSLSQELAKWDSKSTGHKKPDAAKDSKSP